MNETYIRLLNETFNFLPNLIQGKKANHCEEVVFGIVSSQLLQKVPSRHSHVGSLVNVYVDDFIYIVNSASEWAQVNYDLEAKSNYAYEGTETDKGETVLDCCLRTGIIPKYVVQITTGHVIENHTSKPNWRMKIYLLRGVEQWDEQIEQFTNEQRELLEAQISAGFNPAR